jgi:hypothetical protein
MPLPTPPPAWLAPAPASPQAAPNSPEFARLWAELRAIPKAAAWGPGPGTAPGALPSSAPGSRWRIAGLALPPGLAQRPWHWRPLLKELGRQARRPVKLLPPEAKAKRGELVLRLLPGGPAGAGGYALELQAEGQGAALRLQAHDPLGWGYACHRAMAWTGWRAIHHRRPVGPRPSNDGTTTWPALGAREAWSPDKAFRVRAFAPHLYHPCALSLAVHRPGAESLAEVESYLDWLVAGRQNTAVFLLLELDAPNRYWPQPYLNRPHEAWLRPHWQAIASACHRRGLRALANVALANYVSRNAHAIPPGQAIAQNYLLAGARAWFGPGLAEAALASARATTRPALTSAIDRWLAAGWDGLVWNLGTSEFSPTDGPLTLAWLEDASAHMAAHWPGKSLAANSHVPLRPWSQELGESYYNLLRFAPTSVGSWSHTVQAYGLTDPAPVYGGQDFAHKLRLLAAASPAREDLYYPETSYWVSNDASVPLFLPVYALNRAHDAVVLRRLPHLDGWATFTTAWEGGYWLNDWLSAELSARPRAGLAAHLEALLRPWAQAALPAQLLLKAWMELEQGELIEGGLIRDLQGFDALSEFGAAARHTPLLRHLLEGTNNIPERTRLAALLQAPPQERLAWAKGPWQRLKAFASASEALTRAWWGLAPSVPLEWQEVHAELGWAMRLTHLRAQQIAALQEAVLAEAEGRHASTPAQGLAAMAQRQAAWERAQACTKQAWRAVRQAERFYRDPPEVAYGRAQGPTMWNDRLMTPVHEGRYWRHSLDEVAQLLALPPSQAWPEDRSGRPPDKPLNYP